MHHTIVVLLEEEIEKGVYKSKPWLHHINQLGSFIPGWHGCIASCWAISHGGHFGQVNPTTCKSM